MTERHLFQATFQSKRRWMALCGTSVLALGTTLVSWALDDAKPAQPAETAAKVAAPAVAAPAAAPASSGSPTPKAN